MPRQLPPPPLSMLLLPPLSQALVERFGGPAGGTRLPGSGSPQRQSHRSASSATLLVLPRQHSSREAWGPESRQQGAAAPAAATQPPV